MAVRPCPARNWVEIKHNGFRLIVRREDSRCVVSHGMSSIGLIASRPLPTPPNTNCGPDKGTGGGVLDLKIVAVEPATPL